MSVFIRLSLNETSSKNRVFSISNDEIGFEKCLATSHVNSSIFFFLKIDSGLLILYLREMNTPMESVRCASCNEPLTLVIDDISMPDDVNLHACRCHFHWS